MTEIKVDVKNCYKLNLFILKSVGFYSDDSNIFLNYLKRFIFLFLLVIVVEVLATIHFVSSPISYLYVGPSIAEAGYTVRLLIIASYGQKVNILFNFFQNRNLQPKSRYEMYSIDEWLKYCRKINIILSVSVVLSLLSFYKSSFLERQLPLSIWLPFDYNSTSLRFHTTFVLSCLGK